MTTDLVAFLKKAERVADSSRPRLIFALDATYSRAATWNMAKELQSKMFSAAGTRLSVQLVYHRGVNECAASHWTDDTQEIRDLMQSIDCLAGLTQIGRVMTHVADENARRPVNAFVYIGDSMEEHIDALEAQARILGTVKVPGFFFQEGTDSRAEHSYKLLAAATGGAWARFDANAAATLADLLSSVAAYASGGLAALEKRGGEGARLLLAQLKH